MNVLWGGFWLIWRWAAGWCCLSYTSYAADELFCVDLGGGRSMERDIVSFFLYSSGFWGIFGGGGCP